MKRSALGRFVSGPKRWAQRSRCVCDSQGVAGVPATPSLPGRTLGLRRAKEVAASCASAVTSGCGAGTGAAGDSLPWPPRFRRLLLLSGGKRGRPGSLAAGGQVRGDSAVLFRTRGPLIGAQGRALPTRAGAPWVHVVGPGDKGRGFPAAVQPGSSSARAHRRYPRLCRSSPACPSPCTCQASSPCSTLGVR